MALLGIPVQIRLTQACDAVELGLVREFHGTSVLSVRGPQLGVIYCAVLKDCDNQPAGPVQ